jgi:hypothetical protein
MVEPVHGGCQPRSRLNPPVGWRLSDGVRPAEGPRAPFRPSGAGGPCDTPPPPKG